MQINKCDTITLIRRKKKSYNDLERHRKGIWKNSTFIHNKYTKKTRWRRNIHNKIKAIKEKQTANIILSGKRLETSLRSETTKGHPLLPIQLNIIREGPTRANSQDTKTIFRKEELKPSLFAGNIIL